MQCKTHYPSPVASNVHGSILLALLTLLAMPATAQRQAPYSVTGERVRVSAPPLFERPVIGMLRDVTRDTMYLTASGGSRLAIPASAIQWVDRSAGKNRRGNMIIGGAVGALTVAGVIILTDDTGGVGLLVGPIAGLLVGIPVGARIGALVARERWTRVNYADLRPY